MPKVFSVQDRHEAFEYVLSAARQCGRIIALVQVGFWATGYRDDRSNLDFVIALDSDGSMPEVMDFIRSTFVTGENQVFLCSVFKGWTKMNLSDCYLEEDRFPKIFTDYKERDYGILFYNEDNKDSFDSNHAVIYKDQTEDLPSVLSDIVHFYSSKGIRPIIYQSMLDDNWFGEIKEYLAAAGFRSWIEDQEYMLPAGENQIIPNPEVEVRKVVEWKDELEQVFREAEEPWEIKVARKTLEYPKAWMFAAYLEEKPVGLLYGHISERACRVDYLLVAKKHRKTGVGRTLFSQYMKWCKENGIDNIYIWPDGDTPKRIYEEGGFRVMETRKAGRAVFEANGNKTRC